MTQRQSALLAIGLAPICVWMGCEKKQRATPTSPSHVESRADDALRQMGAALSSARAFSFKSRASMDELLPSGQLAAFSRETTIVARRPDRLFAEIHRGTDNWSIWYAGADLTILDKSAKSWASAQVPGSIDAMLEEVEKKYGLTMPLSDLLFVDPYKILIADVLAGHYVGQHEVHGVKCSHLLFTQENVDWQIWIDAENKPLPRKVLIDYKNQPGRPQFEASLSDWNLSASVNDDQFKPALPADAAKVDLAQLLKDAEGPPEVHSEKKQEHSASLPSAVEGHKDSKAATSSHAPGSDSR